MKKILFQEKKWETQTQKIIYDFKNKETIF